VFQPQGASGFGELNSAFAIALHMHQPLIPAGGPELRTAQMISNLQWMWTIRTSMTTTTRVYFCGVTNAWASSSLNSSTRVPAAGHARVLWHAAYGLRQMGATDVLDALAHLTGDERNRRAVSGWAARGATPWLLHSGPGLPPSRPGLAAPLCRHLWP